MLIPRNRCDLPKKLRDDFKYCFISVFVKDANALLISRRLSAKSFAHICENSCGCVEDCRLGFWFQSKCPLWSRALQDYQNRSFQFWCIESKPSYGFDSGESKPPI